MGVDLWKVSYEHKGRFDSETYNHLFDLFFNVDTGMLVIEDKEEAIKEINEMDIDEEEKKDLLLAVELMEEMEDYRVF